VSELTPAERATGFRDWAMAEDRPEDEWVITRDAARHLIALAERATEWERIAAERGTRMDEIQARAERAESLAQQIRNRAERAEERADQAEAALREINDLDEDNFKSAWHYQTAVRFIARDVLARREARDG
jgi:uncharacterized protein (DUF3084 family)